MLITLVVGETRYRSCEREGLVLEDPEPREGSGPALRAGLKAPWRVSAPSSCKGALKLARGRRKGGCLASWVSRSSWSQASKISRIKKWLFGLELTTGWVCGSSVVRHRLSVTLSGESESDDQL